MKVVPGGGSAVTCAVVVLVSSARVRAGALTVGVDTSAELEVGVGWPLMIASAVMLYVVPGVRPGTVHVVVLQEAVMQVSPFTGQAVTLYESTGLLFFGGSSVMVAAVGLSSAASTMLGALQAWKGGVLGGLALCQFAADTVQGTCCYLLPRAPIAYPAAGVVNVSMLDSRDLVPSGRVPSTTTSYCRRATADHSSGSISAEEAFLGCNQYAIATCRVQHKLI